GNRPASGNAAGDTPRQGPALGYLDEASRGRRVTRAGIWLRGNRSGEVPGSRSGEHQYDAIPVVGAEDEEKLIDCNDCDSAEKPVKIELRAQLAKAADSKIVLRRVNFPPRRCCSDEKELS